MNLRHWQVQLFAARTWLLWPSLMLLAVFAGTISAREAAGQAWRAGEREGGMGVGKGRFSPPVLV